MNARDIFAVQLGQASPYTSNLLHELVESGQLVEGSDAHQYRLNHVGERMVFALVYYGYMGESPFRAVVEQYFETEIDDFVDTIKDTHKFDGYNTTTPPHIPRFLPNTREIVDGATKIHN